MIMATDAFTCRIRVSAWPGPAAKASIAPFLLHLASLGAHGLMQMTLQPDLIVSWPFCASLIVLIPSLLRDCGDPINQA